MSPSLFHMYNDYFMTKVAENEILVGFVIISVILKFYLRFVTYFFRTNECEFLRIFQLKKTKLTQVMSCKN